MNGYGPELPLPIFIHVINYVCNTQLRDEHVNMIRQRFGLDDVEAAPGNADAQDAQLAILPHGKDEDMNR